LLKYGPRDPAWLNGLEAAMADTGTAIARARAEAAARLNRALVLRGQAGAFPCAELALTGDMDDLLREKGPRARDEFREQLAKLRMRDAELRRTTLGPHLSDLRARHSERRMDARDCSTGEQKALLVSIILADAWELASQGGGLAPVLLLDEIAAHLDARRRAALFEEVLALGSQAWMTGTDLSQFETLTRRADIFSVAEGKLQQHT
jgi:DNA replication and repair protein RecF